MPGLHWSRGRSEAKRYPGYLGQGGGARWRPCVGCQRHAREGEAVPAGLSGSFSLKQQGWLSVLSVQPLNNVDARGVVWGGGEQLWDWKAWRRSVELSKEEKWRDEAPLQDGAPWRGKERKEGQSCCCQGSLFARLVGC